MEGVRHQACPKLTLDNVVDFEADLLGTDALKRKPQRFSSR